MVQGTAFTADHYCVRNREDGGVDVITWSDSGPAGEHFGSIRTFYNLKPDPDNGDCYNTLQSINSVRYWAEDKQRDFLLGIGFLASRMESWIDFPKPDESETFHGLLVTDELNQEHKDVIAAEDRSWREWTEGVPPELVKDGRLIQQRPVNRYKKPPGTQTFYARSVTDTGNTIHAAQNERTIEHFKASAANVSENSAAKEEELSFLFTTLALMPNLVTWPNGLYRWQIDASAAGSDMTFGCLTIGGAAGHFARINAGASAHVGSTWTQTQGAFSGAGLHIASRTLTPPTGSVDDRFEMLMAQGNAACHGTQGITLELNEADDFVEGPWATLVPLQQARFRYFDDDGDEENSTPLADLNTDLIITLAQLDTNIRLRFGMANRVASLLSDDWQTQYQLNEGGSWFDLDDLSDVVRSSASIEFDELDETSDRLGGSLTFEPGGLDETNGQEGVELPGFRRTEEEFCFQARSADLGDGDFVDFRLILLSDSGPILYTELPRLTIQDAAAGPESVGSAIGEAIASGQPTPIRAGQAEGKAESEASAQSTAVRISTAAGQGEAKSSAFGSRVAISGAAGKGDARASAQGIRARTSRSSARGEARASARGTVIRAGRAQASGETAGAARGAGIRAGRSSAIGESSAKGIQGPKRSRATATGEASATAQPTPVRAGRSVATGDSVAIARGSAVRAGRSSAAGESSASAFAIVSQPIPAKGKGEAVTSAQSTAIRAGKSAGVGETLATARGARVVIAGARGEGEASTTARGLPVRLSRASARGESSASAKGAVVHLGRAVAEGEGAVSATPTAIRAGRAAGVGETRAKGRPESALVGKATGIGETSATARGSRVAISGASAKGESSAAAKGLLARLARASARGESRSSAKGIVARRGRASAVGEARAKGSPPIPISFRAAGLGESRASARGTVVRAGRGHGIGETLAKGFLVRVSWKYWLIRGGTEYEQDSFYLPTQVDTEAVIHPRNRPLDRDRRKARLLSSRAWPVLRAQLLIRLNGEVHYKPRDLAGASISITITDTHANVIVSGDDVVIDDGPEARVSYDWSHAALVPGTMYLAQFRVAWSAPLPLLFPLRRETLIEVAT